MPTYAHKTDTTQAAILETFVRSGCAVINTSAYAKFVDGVLADSYGTFLIEAKSKYGKLTPGQAKLYAEWPGDMYVLESAEQANLVMMARRQFYSGLRPSSPAHKINFMESHERKTNGSVARADQSD